MNFNKSRFLEIIESIFIITIAIIISSVVLSFIVSSAAVFAVIIGISLIILKIYEYRLNLTRDEEE